MRLTGPWTCNEVFLVTIDIVGYWGIICLLRFNNTLSSRIRFFVYKDSSYDSNTDLGSDKLYEFLYGRIGLQKTFGMKGLRLHINFEIMGMDSLGYQTYPSQSNLRYVVIFKYLNTRDISILISM